MKSSLLVIFLLSISIFASESKKSEFLSPATPISGPLTAFVNTCDSTLEFYETEHLGHWLWGDTICRGVARLSHIRDDFYQLEGNMPGSYCMDSILIRRIPQRGSSINLIINLPDLKYDLAVIAQPLGRDFFIENNYNHKSRIRLPVNENGYRLAIATKHPTGRFPLNSICFSNTIKFLLFPELDPSLFSSGCNLIIDLPLFDETCFFEWNLNGEIVRMNKDTLIYKNIEYVRTNN